MKIIPLIPFQRAGTSFEVKAEGFSTVGELIEALKTVSPETPVVLMDFQNDDETTNEVAKPLIVVEWTDKYGKVCYIDPIGYRTWTESALKEINEND